MNSGGEKGLDKNAERVNDEDRVRMRGGFSVNGGAMFFPESSASPAFALAGRIGIQLGRYLGIVYQNTPMVTATLQSASLGAGYNAAFVDYNSFLLVGSFFHVFDVAAGPSVDFLAVANGSVTVLGGSQGTSSSGVYFGAHTRLAIDIGSFSIGFDVHPMFTDPGTAISITGGLGGEFY